MKRRLSDGERELLAERRADEQPEAEQAQAELFRVRFVIDPEASFEECNGEARPLTAEEYAENQYMGCPVHPRSKVMAKSQPAQPGRAWCGECGREHEPIPYAEYLEYYGNAERHVYLGAIVDKLCTHCGSWTEAGSLWHIDLMDDDRELTLITLNKPMAIDQAPGYLGEVARELVAEAR